MRTFSRTLIGVTAAGISTLAVAFPAFASTSVVVTPSNTQGWSTADTRPGGAVTFIADSSSPGPTGALQFTTDATTAAKAQYLHPANTDLSAVTSLGYSTKQVSAPFAGAAASYQLVMFLNGGTAGFSTLVFEPYQNTAQGTVTANAWQHWNVASGLFWSTRTVTCANGVVNGTPGGPASYTLAQITALCPDALVAGFGLNIGTNNPSYKVEADLFDFNGTVYDFELDAQDGGGGDCNGICPPPTNNTPELDSLLLFGTGLSGLGGYAVMRLRARRRR
jgi:hypothetical protein